MQDHSDHTLSIKTANESILIMHGYIGSWIHHDPGDLAPMVLIQIFPEELIH